MDNDLVMAAAALLEHGEARPVAIVDVDVHQGNGTAELGAGDDTPGGGCHADPDRTVAAPAAGLLAVAETLGAGRATC